MLRYARVGLMAPVFLAAAPGLAVEGAYASLNSVAQGGTIEFHISTRARRYSLALYREGPERVLMARVRDLAGEEHSCPGSAYETGCGWPVALRFEIPRDWPSGVYTGEFDVGATGSEKDRCIFVIREDDPGSTSRILLSRAVNTDNAYNSFGGKSLYRSNSSGEEPARKVSFDRPYNSGTGNYSRWEHLFVAWAEGRGYALEYSTNIDLHEDAVLLGPYSCFVIVGHDEYWTREMRDHVDAFTSAGGNVMILGGNTCWWQVRFTPDLRTMTCYKAYALEEDPYALDGDPANDHLITTNWYKAPVNYPENSTTGLGWRHGGYHNRDGKFTYEQGFGGYRVYLTDHWIFRGTGLDDGRMLGRQETIVGYEVDGTLLEARDAAGDLAWDRQGHYPAPGALPHVVRTSETKTPADFVVLGLAPATSGHAVMGVFETAAGGRVFNAGTIEWVHGLASDAAVARITANVLEELSGVLPSTPFRRGDANTDGKVNVSDAVSILLWTFQGGAEPDCLDAADTNDDEKQDMTDAVFLLIHLFQGGPPPPEPGTRRCGPSPSPSLGCDSYPRCGG